MTAKVSRIYFRVIPDPTPDLGYLDEQTESGDGEAAARARARLQSYENGDWNLVGVQAIAEIAFTGIDTGAHLYTGNKIVSPGLWNVESDMNEATLHEVCDSELPILEDMLLTLGLDALPEPDYPKIGVHV